MSKVNFFDIHPSGVLINELRKSDEVWIATAFLSSNDFLRRCLTSQVKVRLVFGLKFPTHPNVVRDLLEYSKSSQSKVFYRREPKFHPKVYLFFKNQKPTCAVIGSSNCTQPGLTSNDEYNVVLRAQLGQVKTDLDQFIKSGHVLTRSLLKPYEVSYYKAASARPPAAGWPSTAANHYTWGQKIWSEIGKELEPRWMKESGRFPYWKDLPFTYVFDHFCHSLIGGSGEMNKSGGFPKLSTNGSTERGEYFLEFMRNYLPLGKESPGCRSEQYRLSEIIASASVAKLSDAAVRSFFLCLHSIASGADHGKAKRAVNDKVNGKHLRELIERLIDEDQPIQTRITLALTDPDQGGYRIKYLGKSAIQEIPGWLLPELYPIVNDKFFNTLKHLGFKPPSGQHH